MAGLPGGTIEEQFAAFVSLLLAVCGLWCRGRVLSGGGRGVSSAQSWAWWAAGGLGVGPPLESSGRQHW